MDSRNERPASRSFVAAWPMSGTTGAARELELGAGPGTAVPGALAVLGVMPSV